MWETPKTDWHYELDSEGLYVGDRFNATDFNRIKNNLEHLRGLAIKMYDDFTIHALGADRTPKDYFYADEINQLEENLNTVNEKMLKEERAKTTLELEEYTVKRTAELQEEIVGNSLATIKQLEQNYFDWRNEQLDEQAKKFKLINEEAVKDVDDREKTYRDWETDRKSTRLNSSH